MAAITVLGAGGWGMALATMAHGYGHQVSVWSPFQEEIDGIRRDGEHKKLLPGVPVPLSIELTSDLSCAAKADMVIMAVPSFAVSSTARQLKEYLQPNTLVVMAGKGLEPGTHRRFSQVLAGELPEGRIVVMSGPSHAEEVGRGVPTSLIMASARQADAEAAQDMLMNPRFRLYVTDDVAGVELGGALKNAIALAAGICDGLNLGDNTKAALMTRGLAEITRLGVAMGARAETFSGLSGIGDLIVTCGSMHSRNRRAGILIGQGLSAEEAIRQVGTVEGYFVCEAACAAAQEVGVEMPITEQCYRICYQGLAAREALENLLNRPKQLRENYGW